MRETSFGKMEIILKNGTKPSIEHLIFEKEGRSHKHKEYESFYVISGSGKVISGDKTYDVTTGSLVTIPPDTSHWMVPDINEKLEGFLWYHDVDLRFERQL